jgi:hypothetical protein
MRTLPAATTNHTPTSTLEDASNVRTTQESRGETENTPSSAIAAPIADSAAPASPTKPTSPPDLNRTETEAIGPSTDTPAVKPDNSNGPVVIITLLLITGARHPYKIDERYLKKRNVNVEDMDPYNISVYTLKELIWRDWREGMPYVLPLLSSQHMFGVQISGSIVTFHRPSLTQLNRMGAAAHIPQLDTTDPLRTHAG